MTTFVPSPNFTPGRAGIHITDLVLHWMDGTLADTDAEFTGGSRGVSAHYGIQDTTIHQYVHDGDTAWHAGDWNENQRSIGIEHSAAPGRDATAATIATSVALQVQLCNEYGIDPSHIYPHQRFFNTACPGTLPIAEMVTRVRAGLAVPVSPAPPVPAGPVLLEDIMKPWFIRAATGAIVIVGPGGVRPLTPAAWQVWKNLGAVLDPAYASMDPGPFASVIADLGGLQK